MNYTSKTSQFLRAITISALFVIPYVILNSIAMKLFPELSYYLDAQILLIVYLPLFFALLTYRMTYNTNAAISSFITNLIVGSLLYALYIYFPYYNDNFKLIFTFLLPLYAVYNYFALERRF